MRFARFCGSFWSIGLLVASGCGAPSSSLPASPSMSRASSWTARSAGSSVREKILYDFPASGQGAHPGGSLVYDRAGSFYALTLDGGATCGQFVCGTIVKFSGQDGRYTPSVVYRFHNNGDGYFANGLIVDASGTIYGTSACCYYGQKGGGVLFKLTPGRRGYKFTTLFAFSGAGPYPNAGLITDRTGKFFATAYQGGASGFGAIFELIPVGSGYAETTLYSFSGGTDGANPAVGLTAGASGELYGTTAFGGQQSCGQGAGCGTVYELTPDAVAGYKERVLYAFGGNTDGNEPFAAVVRDGKGNLFGTTQYGGGAPSCPDGCGTVYELKRSSSSYAESVLYNFSGTGYNPIEPVVVNRAGAIYGTTPQGGSANNGTVFKLAPSGSGYVESDAYLFQGPPNDGEYPNALTIGRKGRLFGTTVFGGSGPASQCGNDLGCGVVFELRGERAGT